MLPPSHEHTVILLNVLLIDSNSIKSQKVPLYLEWRAALLSGIMCVTWRIFGGIIATVLQIGEAFGH